MRVLMIPAALVALAGCAMTPEQLSARSNWDVCRLSMTPAQGRVAEQEAQRRGLDCRPYYGPIQAQQANENAAIQNYLRSTQPAPMPTPMNCRTVRIGNSLETQCF